MALLETGSTPPIFTLAQADGSRFELSSILGRERILIAFSPTLGCLKDTAMRQAELRDYELQVLAMPEPQVLAEAPPSSDWLHIGAAPDAVADAYGVRAGDAAAFLIGNDGGVKQIYAGEADLDEVLALIDTMPMRRAQIARRSR